MSTPLPMPYPVNNYGQSMQRAQIAPAMMVPQHMVTQTPLMLTQDSMAGHGQFYGNSRSMPMMPQQVPMNAGMHRMMHQSPYMDSDEDQG